MNRGDLFAIGRGRKVSCLCEFRGENSDGSIEGYVINGAWDFTLRGDQLTVHYSGITFPSEIVWQGRLPDGVGGYNGAIEWIEDQLQCFAITRWWRQKVFAVGRRIERVKRAWKAGKKAYKAVYAADSRFVQDEDDLIPF